MMNIIAIITCTVCAIIQGVRGDFLWCIIDILLVASNVPFALEWIKHTIHND